MCVSSQVLINEKSSICLEKQVLLDEDLLLEPLNIAVSLYLTERARRPSAVSQVNTHNLPCTWCHTTGFPHTVCKNKCKVDALCRCKVFRFLPWSRCRSSLKGFLPSNHCRRNWGKSSKKKAKPNGIGMEVLNATKTTTTCLVMTGYLITNYAKCISDSHWK